MCIAIIQIYTVPSGAPLNITAIAQSSSSILISWQPPQILEQNGIVSSYDVEINTTDPSIKPRKYRFPANTTNITVTGNPKCALHNDLIAFYTYNHLIAAGLEKYTDFQVFVAAGTSLGYGPFSKSVSVKTFEDGRLALH